MTLPNVSRVGEMPVNPACRRIFTNSSGEAKAPIDAGS